MGNQPIPSIGDNLADIGKRGDVGNSLNGWTYPGVVKREDTGQTGVINRPNTNQDQLIDKVTPRVGEKNY
jgi:hypothetical protein